MCMISMPARIACARREGLNPVISFILRLILRWPCSTRLFRYLLCLLLMQSSFSLPAFNSASAAVFAPLLSMVTTSGSPCRRIALRKKHRAADASLSAGSRWFASRESTARYRYFYLYLHSDVCFVHSPAPAGTVFIPAEYLIQQRHHANNSPVQGGIVNSKDTLNHEFFQIAQTEGIRQIPADTLSSNRGFRANGTKTHA